VRLSSFWKPLWLSWRVVVVVCLALGLFCAPTGWAESLILPERVGALLPPHNKWRATPTLPQACRHWAEVQVTLDETWTLDRFDRLPCAPGSRMEILKDGGQIRAQWPAVVVADLIEEGACLEVVRDFMLVQNDGNDARVVDKSRTSATVDDYVRARNDTDVDIPYLEYAYSDIQIQEAESHALVTTIDVHYEIVHPFSGDVAVDISDEGLVGPYLSLMEGGSADNINETVTGITEFAGRPVNQHWFLWAIDLYMGYSGYIDSWWIKVYYTYPTETAEHDLCENAIVLEDGVPYEGRTVGATGNYVTYSGYNDALDVWHVFTPTQTGLATVHVESDDTVEEDYLDTTLAIFDGCNGRELASIDDLCDSTGGRITMLMEAGLDYYIRVAGYGYATGNYTLTVTQHPIEFPDEPSGPTPADGTEAVETSTVLAWNDWAFDTSSASRSSKDKGGDMAAKIIYGSDDRRDEYEVTDADMLGAGDSTVALVYWSAITINEDGTYTLPSSLTLGRYYELADPIGSGNSLCRDEPYRNQPTAAFCSGVLVTPDIVATAGHCVACLDPDEVAVVFGYVMEDDITPVLTIQPDQVYSCAEIIARQEGNPDWSLIRLDRPVPDHAPMLTRIAGQIEAEQGTLVTGHPYGMPRKYEDGGVVKTNEAAAFFEINADALEGNSGSPVYNLDTYEVEGLLVSGPSTSFETYPDEGCDRSRVCPDETGCPEFAWERVTRITVLSQMIPSYDLYLGTDPNNLELVSGYGVTPWFEPSQLEAETTYYWRVTARNVWGQTDGTLWSFTTAAAPTCSPVYRFWSETYSYHFYTISESERDNLIDNYPDVWTYDGQAFCAYAEGSVSGLAPVYRFWSPTTYRHFYTISESEKDKLINDYPDDVWTYEGVVFYAFAEGDQPEGTRPVYRFWSDQIGAHYYTIDEAEKDQIIAEQSDIWTFEGVAWYAYE